MRLLPCSPPDALRETAPITSLLFHTDAPHGVVTAFWDEADRYLVCITPGDGGAPRWYCGDTDARPEGISEDERRVAAALL